jgi:hypothetical protein
MRASSPLAGFLCFVALVAVGAPAAADQSDAGESVGQTDVLTLDGLLADGEEEEEEGEDEEGEEEEEEDDGEDAAPSRALPGVIYTSYVGGGVALGYGSLMDSGTLGTGFVGSSFALELSRFVGFQAGVGYQFRTGGSLVDESPEDIDLDTDLGTTHHLFFEAGARFTFAPDSAFSPRVVTSLQAMIHLGDRDVIVYRDGVQGNAFQNEVMPYFVLDFIQPVADLDAVDLVVGLRATQGLGPAIRATGNNDFDLFQNPGGNVDGNATYTTVGLLFGVEY